MNLIDVLDHYGVVTEERGIERWTSCPFHEDADPSFSVSPKGDGYVYYCFSCKSGGGSIEFIAEYEKVSYKDAKKIYNKLAGIVDEVNPEQDLLSEMMDFISIKDHPYLSGRGVSKKAIQEFKLGFCDSYDDLLSHFHLSRQDADHMGLWDISNSIIYPYFDMDGCFKFHSRNISDKIYRKKKSKTYRESLWGINKIKGDEVYLFEGFHDALVAWDYGYPAVAMAGTNMFDEYWNELKTKGIDRIIFVPDGDLAGINFLEKMMKNFRSEYIIEVIEVVTGDPDDAILNGTFPDLKRKSLMEWYTDHKWRDVSSISDKVQMFKDIQPYYLKLSDIERVMYKSYFKTRFGDDESLDYLYFNIEPDFKVERIVLANCIYSENVKYDTMHEIDESYFHTKQNRNIFLFLRDNHATAVLVDKEFGLDFSSYVDLMNYKLYIENLRDIGDKERLVKVLDISRSRMNGSADEISGKVIQELHTISDHSVYIAEPEEVVRRVMNKISERISNPHVAGIPLDEKSFPVLNKSLMGLIPQKFILLSGNTGHGKTTMVSNMIDPIIFERNEPILFFTLEMTPEEIIEKQLAIHTGVAGAKIMTGSLEQSEYDALVDTARTLMKKNLIVVSGVYDLYKLISIAKSLIIRKKIKIIVVDYLQLIRVEGRKDRWEQLMDITKIWKTQVCSMGATLIGISQLGKNALKTQVAQASEQSGSYGMLADVDVAITIRQKQLSEIKEGSNFEIFVDKHRYNIDNILIEAMFDKGTQRITEV